MGRKDSGETFYAQDDPLVAVFSVLMEMMKEMDKVSSERRSTICPLQESLKYSTRSSKPLIECHPKQKL
jgi:hypothetical protein